MYLFDFFYTCTLRQLLRDFIDRARGASNRKCVKGFLKKMIIIVNEAPFLVLYLTQVRYKGSL